ncbi:natriuretic peptide A-like [Chanos chanos]|uniref:Natriuretic peptide A-like n=1 Tax=Chanos chanos TaxID=29144 RepID=A0A6J2W7P8_CHACN|nr:C-type natriuretic peptide 3-like [Chanos chanos]
MTANIYLVCFSSLVLFSFVGAKPISNLQSLKQLLEEEENTPYFESEKPETEVKDLNTEKTAFGADGEHSWESAVWNSSPAGKDDVLARLLNDILSTSKRSWSRFKKGGLRSCFGVRLERIGSFSGLGC